MMSLGEHRKPVLRRIAEQTSLISTDASTVLENRSNGALDV